MVPKLFSISREINLIWGGGNIGGSGWVEGEVSGIIREIFRENWQFSENFPRIFREILVKLLKFEITEQSVQHVVTDTEITEIGKRSSIWLSNNETADTYLGVTRVRLHLRVMTP